MRRPGTPYFASSIADGRIIASGLTDGDVIARVQLSPGRWAFRLDAGSNAPAQIGIYLDGSLRYSFHVAGPDPAGNTREWQMVMRGAGVVSAAYIDDGVTRPTGMSGDLIATQVGSECD